MIGESGDQIPAGAHSSRIVDVTAGDEELSTRRRNVMRVGYAFMGVGLAIVKWPVLIQDAASLPVSEGVVACLLTAMSLLAFLGLRYPVRMLPILLFEVTWKVIWIAAVAFPTWSPTTLTPRRARCCSTVPSSSSSSPSSRGDTPGGATSGRPGTRGVDERRSTGNPPTEDV